MYIDFGLLIFVVAAAFLFGFILCDVLNIMFSHDEKLKFTDTYERLKK